MFCSVSASDFGGRGRGFDPHMGRRVLSLSKTNLLPDVPDDMIQEKVSVY